MLVRHPVTMPAWWRSLPSLPGGCDITVSLPLSTGQPRDVVWDSSLSDPANRHQPGGQYRPITVAYPDSLMPADGNPVADLLIPPAIIAAQEDWWAMIRHGALRIFDLRMGPVLAVLMPILTAHVDATARPPQ